MKRQLGQSISVDDGIENYDYNNKNDVENFCPAVRVSQCDVIYLCLFAACATKCKFFSLVYFG